MSSPPLDHRRRHSMPVFSSGVPEIVIDSSPCDPIIPDDRSLESQPVPPLSVFHREYQPTNPSLPFPDSSPSSPDQRLVDDQAGPSKPKREKLSRFASIRRALPHRILSPVDEQASEDERAGQAAESALERSSSRYRLPPAEEAPSKVADRLVQSVRNQQQLAGPTRPGFFRRLVSSPSLRSSSRPGSSAGEADDHSLVVDEQTGQASGILSSLLALAAAQNSGEPDSRAATPAATPMGSPPRSGTSTPRFKSPYGFGSRSNSSSTTQVATGGLGSPSESPRGSFLTPSQDLVSLISEKLRYEQNKHKLRKYKQNIFRRTRAEREERVKSQIAQMVARQQFLVRLCWALMRYGAPSHRLEEYLATTAAVLHVDGQFLYTPACTIISFDDASTHTTEVKLVRAEPGVDLGKLYEVHDVYKHVTHGVMSVDDAAAELKQITERGDKYPRWARVLAHGLAAASVGPFGFQARMVDVPMGFLLGIVLGTLQLFVAEFGTLYSNLFEIGAAFVTSFLARAIGSINSGSTFCFSALAQSSIALILPGYIVLCACLELTSHNLLAGSVRMVYAVLYTIFLGYGIMIGSTLYGLFDSDASSAVGCTNPMHYKYNVIFVALFTLSLCMVNQAHWRHTPVMIFIAVASYCVTFFSGRFYFGTSPLSNMCGSFVIGVLANLYSRLGPMVDNWTADAWLAILDFFRRSGKKAEKKTDPEAGLASLSIDPTSISPAPTAIGSPDPEKTTSRVHFDAGLPDYPYNRTDSTKTDGSASPEEPEPVQREEGARKKKIGYNLAAAAMLPALFVQVPSGLAVQGSLLTGIASADDVLRQHKRSLDTAMHWRRSVSDPTIPVALTDRVSNTTIGDVFASGQIGLGSEKKVEFITVSLSEDGRTISIDKSVSSSLTPTPTTPTDPSRYIVSRAADAPDPLPTVSYNVNTSALNIMYSVVQVGVAMTVGLSLGVLVVYPFGKQKRGVFTF